MESGGRVPEARDRCRRRNEILAVGEKGYRQIGKGAARRLCLGIVPFAAILFCSPPASFGADLITGVVRNATRAQLAAGDEVVLLDLDHSPHEEARTKIDSQGSFVLELQDPGHPHIVRVVHQGVNYDKRVSAGGAISIDVFDSTVKAPGVTGSIEIIRAGTRGNALHVSDMIEVRNESNPPVTQAGARSFEVYLPADSTIDSVLAAGPENIASSISAEPVRGEPGQYTVNFPVRPGATKFAFNYDMPYKGHAKFRAKSIYPFQQLAVMIPPTMTFTARSFAFRALPVGSDRYHVEAAQNVKAGVGLEFEISGTGALPSTQARSRTAPNPPAEAAIGSASAIAAGTSPTPKAVAIAAHAQGVAVRSSIVWWWVSGAALLGFAVCVFLIWRRRWLQRQTIAFTAQPAHELQRPVYLVDALNEGLFQLEADRVQGVIRGEEYSSAKHALEATIRWALTRTRNHKANTAAP
jgi:hypothetical protein